MKLEAIIRHYLLHYYPDHDSELRWFGAQPSLEDAMRVAGRAQDDRGKRYSHQRRIKRKSIADATDHLIELHDNVRHCSSFHELWNLIRRELETAGGIGELYVYDTSLRIGAHLGLRPERVYLHAGTRVGAKKLGLIPLRGCTKEWLESNELPVVLRNLAPSDVENLLCIYKNQLPPNKINGTGGCGNRKPDKNWPKRGCH
jgi:hypothetical protein